MDENVGAILFVVLIAAIGVASIVWHFARSKSILQSWADEHGLRLIDCKYRWIARGPFFCNVPSHEAHLHPSH